MTYLRNPSQPPPGLALEFEHWYCMLSAEELRKYGSPHFDRKTVGQELARAVEMRASRMAQGSRSIQRDQVIVSNHAYPEAAVVDPLADLELWEEWRLGIREFPYLGQYAPLGLFKQDIKTSSPSSVGVVGEILAGLIAESLVAPTILVRVIRRWPDFILYPGTQKGKNIFAFVESKAVGPDSDVQRHVFHGRVPEPLFWDAAVAAIQQLNADPLVDVWGAFTWISRIVPFETVVTFIQFVAPDERRAVFPSSDLPAAVLSGISERSVGAAISELSEDDRAMLRAKRARRSAESKFHEESVLRRAQEEFDKIVIEELAWSSVQVPQSVKQQALQTALKRLNLEAEFYGRRFREAKGAEGTDLKFVGSVGGRGVFMMGLSGADKNALQDWTASWDRAFEPWKTSDGTKYWRAGGGLFAIED